MADFLVLFGDSAEPGSRRDEWERMARERADDTLGRPWMRHGVASSASCSYQRHPVCSTGPLVWADIKDYEQWYRGTWKQDPPPLYKDSKYVTRGFRKRHPLEVPHERPE